MRGVEIVAGDWVLYKNWAKGGTGKLRTFWEDSVYVVVEKDENNPVYTIKPEKGRGKLKRVHRNDIMRCNELLSKEPVVPVKTAVETSKPKASIKSKIAASTDVPEKVPDTVGEEGSDSEELLGVVRPTDHSTIGNPSN